MDLSNRSTPRQPRGGFSLVELIIALSVVAVSASIFYRMVIATTALRNQNRENAVAADGARVMLERIRGEDFHDLFALFNADPGDDPAGSGTAPGNTFLIEELRLVEGETAHGTIVLPSGTVSVEQEVEGRTVVMEELWLLENLDLPELGLPRDLNGDSLIDGLDHCLDYQILPIQIVVRWQGLHGPRTFEMTTMLCDLR